MVIEWKKAKEGEGQERGTGESDMGREIVYGPEECINECIKGEKGQKGDHEKRVKKEEGEGGRGTGETGRMA